MSKAQTRHTCILCQEEQEITYNSRAMVLSAFIQRYEPVNLIKRSLFGPAVSHIKGIGTPINYTFWIGHEKLHRIGG